MYLAAYLFRHAPGQISCRGTQELPALQSAAKHSALLRVENQDLVKDKKIVIRGVFHRRGYSDKRFHWFFGVGVVMWQGGNSVCNGRPAPAGADRFWLRLAPSPVTIQ